MPYVCSTLKWLKRQSYGKRKGRWVMRYEKPSIQIIILNSKNTIVTSGLGDVPDEESKDSEDW